MTDNKDIVLKFWVEQDAGRFDASLEHMTPDIVLHMPGMPPLTGREAHKQLAMMFYGAFPDLRHEPGTQIAERDMVVTRFKIVGTHRAPFMQIPATGKRVEVSGVVIDRIAGGRIAERWVSFDQFGMMQQLGAIPRSG